MNPRNHWDSCIKWLGSWSLTRLKLQELQRVIGGSLCGEIRLCWLTELFSFFATAETHAFSDSVPCLGGISTEPVTKHGKVRLNVFGNTFFLKNWIRSMDNKWNSNRKFPKIHHIADPRRDSKDDDWIKVWSRAIQKKDYLHVNVQRDWSDKTKK